MQIVSKKEIKDMKWNNKSQKDKVPWVASQKRLEFNVAGST